VQGLYSLPKNSVWIAKTRHDEWWGENGWFTHSESHTGCPIVETMVCRMHGHFPLLYFFPELEYTTLDAFRHFQVADGEVPFCFGQPTSMRDPRYHCQHPLNSGQYAQMVYQLYSRTGDVSQLNHFYDSAKQAICYQISLDDDGCGLVHEQPHARPGEDWPANQFYDVWPWEGVSSYVAGTWLATLATGAALADAERDREFSNECKQRLHKAQQVFEERLWNGNYYRLWNNTAANRVSEVCLANQMMGYWCAKVAGIAGTLNPERVGKALDSIERLNLKATAYGVVNGATPDGKPFHSGYNGQSDFGPNTFFGKASARR
jgi:non-lysosomal glucosylceramidase